MKDHKSNGNFSIAELALLFQILDSLFYTYIFRQGK